MFWCRVLRAESRIFLLNRLYKTAISLSWPHTLASRRPTEIGTLVCWRLIARASDKVIDAHQRTRRVLSPAARQRTRPGGQHLLHVCLRRGPRRQPLLQLPHALRHRRMVSRGALVWVIDAQRGRLREGRWLHSRFAGVDTACVLCRLCHIATARLPYTTLAYSLAVSLKMCCACGGCRSLFDLVIVTMSLVSLAPLGTANTRRGPCVGPVSSPVCVRAQCRQCHAKVLLQPTVKFAEMGCTFWKRPDSLK